jgi:hypothetical protein
MAEWQPVTFYQGAPVDPSALNQLMSNITHVYTQSRNLLDATSNNGQTESTLPIVFGNSITVSLNKGRGNNKANFGNKFSTIPTVVASITKNLDSDNVQFSVSAKATGVNEATITVNCSNVNYDKSVVVNYIAVAEKQINR